jgi:1-acyl-sn-glycerol-3-phosphate acyltransferase
MSMAILWHAVVETARISLPTVREAQRGTLSHATCDARLRSWAKRLVDRAEIALSVEGLENIQNERGPFVVVSNHESHYDIPCLYVALPLSLRMAAKKELFRTPLWGKALRASGFVEIDRKDPASAYRALDVAGKFMRESSISLFVAPEGTRSRDGRVGPFKKGAFELAQAAKIPVLPVAVQGTREILTKGSRRIQLGCAVNVHVLEPVDPASFSSAPEMAEEVRDLIVAALSRTSVIR